MENIERILYNNDEIIYFDFDDKNNKYFLKINKDKIEIKEKNEMMFLFYLSLFIKGNKNIVKFSFSLSLINKINSINTNNFNFDSSYKNVLISKIILELINFYKNNQLFEEKNYKEEIEKLNEIEISNNEIIVNCIKKFCKIFFSIGQKELKFENIDLIYAKIINILLKLKDYDLAQKILEYLDLENINITNEMLNEICKTLFSNESYLNEYRLNILDDLFDYNKIYFYYFLFKYILKNSIYIYYFDFLYEIRKRIIKIIKENDINKKDYNFKDKVLYVIKFFTNSNYYYEKYIKPKEIKILNSKISDENETSHSSISPFEKSSVIKKKEESQRGGSMFDQNLEINQDSVKNEESKNSQSGLSNSELRNSLEVDSSNYGQNGNSLNLNLKLIEGTIINNNENDFRYKYDIVQRTLKNTTITLNINNSKENAIEIGEMKFYGIEGGEKYEKFKNYFSEEEKKLLKEVNLLESYQKIIFFLEKIKEISKSFFSENQLKLYIKIILKEEKPENNGNSNKKISAEYILENRVILEGRYLDENILNNCDYKGFRKFLNAIVDLNKGNKKPSNFPDTSSFQINSNNPGTSTLKDANKINEGNKFKLIWFKKLIGEHNIEQPREHNIGKHIKFANKIRELDNDSFLSDGFNEIIKYGMDFKYERTKINDYYSFFIDKNIVIVSQKNKLTEFDKLNETNSSFKTDYSYRNLFKLNDKYIICGENGLYLAPDNFRSLGGSQIYNIDKKAYRGGIKINDNILAITSNRILPNGENKLRFFDGSTKNFLDKIEVGNYSFTLSENNCALMGIPKREKEKLLLVACKKYLKDDKNGILLLKLQFYNDEKKEKFYDTKNFEVYCFCPIFKIELKSLFTKIEKNQINETEYFLVGGFDIDKNEGLIKLYKVIYDDNIENIEIEYVLDIIVKKKIGKDKSGSFKGFKGHISCMIQSSIGEILLTCYDGNVYQFSEPNFSLLNQDYNILK